MVEQVSNDDGDACSFGEEERRAEWKNGGDDQIGLG